MSRKSTRGFQRTWSMALYRHVTHHRPCSDFLHYNLKTPVERTTPIHHPGDALCSSVGFSSGNLHQYPELYILPVSPFKTATPKRLHSTKNTSCKLLSVQRKHKWQGCGTNEATECKWFLISTHKWRTR